MISDFSFMSVKRIRNNMRTFQKSKIVNLEILNCVYFVGNVFQISIL